MRALVILDALVMNAGKSYQRRFGDEMLLERLRVMATDQMTDRDVRARLAGMFIGWHEEFKDVQGMSGVAHLKDSLPKKRRPAAQVRPPTPDEADSDDEAAAPSRPARPSGSQGHSRQASRSDAAAATGSSSTSRYNYVEPKTPPEERSSFFGGGGSAKSKKKSTTSSPAPSGSGPRVMSLEKERPVILQTIASANQAATNLTNALRHVNKEDPSFLKLPAVSRNHAECRQLRKKVLHYIAGIQSEDWVGTLLETNDNLVAALQLYENYKSVAEVPDSDEEAQAQAQIQREYHDEIFGASSSSNNQASPARARRGDERAPPKPARPGGAPGTPPAISRSNKPGSIAISPAQQQRRRRPEPETESEEESEAEEEEILSEGDEDDPFANRNEDLALKTPAVEKSQPKW